MKVKLPKLLETYVEASNKNDPKKFIACFADTATVLDEGETLRGHEAISKWFTDTRNKLQFMTEPIGIKQDGNEMVMTATVSGNFKGSPVTLDYYFKTKSGLIEDLKIS